MRQEPSSLASPEREKQLSTETARLALIVDELKKGIAGLSNSLGQVLRSDSPTSPEKMAVPEETLVPAAEVIRRTRRVLEELAREVESLLNRLEA